MLTYLVKHRKQKLDFGVVLGMRILLRETIVDAAAVVRVFEVVIVKELQDTRADWHRLLKSLRFESS